MSGNRYVVFTDEAVDEAPLSIWLSNATGERKTLVDVIRSHRGRRQRREANDEAPSQPQRDTGGTAQRPLFRAASAMRGAGFDQVAIEAALEVQIAQLAIPLDDEEVRRIA